jgi:hypothetical protein
VASPHASNPAEQKILDDVAQHGFHVVNILEEGDLPPFSFTIGLFHSWQHPEVVVYGLPDRTAHLVLNGVAEAVRAGGRYEAGREYEGLLVGYRCTFRVVPAHQYGEHLGFASWFYDHAEFPAIQLIYPDKSQRWPWMDGVTDAFRRHQPVLADL